jgi:hydroxypyruvate reductase
MPSADSSDVLRDARAIHRAALEAVEPAAAVRRVLGLTFLPDDSRIFVIALGKAAPAMAAAAVEHLRSIGRQPEAGIVVSHTAAERPHPRVETAIGDHPVPGARSADASDRLGDLVRQVAPTDVVWVMLSGGTTSLIGAPVATMTVAELADLHSLLLSSGLAIGEMNVIRKRVSRWGAGRLARALEPAAVRVFAISDVPDDDLAALGSGPLAPDPTRVEDVTALLERSGLWERLPRSVRDLLTRDEGLATPGVRDPAFRHVSTVIVASNETAVRAALAHAESLGYRAALARTPLRGEAAAAGDALARELLDARRSGARVCLIAGGEPVVTITGEPNGVGGRAQELALAAARRLADAPDSAAFALLAAGTDGRDGPTDAAGAIVTPRVWRGISSAGRDPERDLAGHDAYRALDAVGALLRTGPTGTNVMDLAVLLAG